MLTIVMDYSIVVRFKPAVALLQEYLVDPAADPSSPGAWSEKRGDAHQFYTHADAQRWAKTHPFIGVDLKPHIGWAEVLGSAEVVPRREELPRVTTPPRARDEARRTAVATSRTAMVDPAETFAELEKRNLA